MKNSHFLVIACVFIAQAVIAQKTEEKEINSKISQVTVFVDGAQVYRSAESEINPGRSVLVFRNLSPYIDQNSIQVRGEGAFTILSVNPRLNYLDPMEESPEIKALKDKIKDLNDKKDMEQARIALLEKKQLLIDANRVFTNNQQTISPEVLAQLTNNYMKSAEEIALGIIEHKKKIRDIESDISKTGKQIEELSAVKMESTGEIVVTVEAKSPVRAKFGISYYTSNASWYPSYDIRVNSTDEPIELVYKSNLQQNTGEEWKEVKLTFSNGTPGNPGFMPVLRPNYLAFNYPVYRNENKYKIAKDAMAGAPESSTRGNRELDEETMFSEPLMVLERENTTTFEFAIENPFTVKSGSGPATIDMKTFSIPANYEYHAIPKLDKSAYLVANLTDWSDLNLLSGEANIYFEKTFVGKSLIDIRSLDDTLRISLGQDKNIVITREKIKDYNTRKFFGANQVVSRAYETGIRNNRNNPVKIIIHDQVPISSNNEIVVEHDELSGARLKSETGELTWTLNMDAKEQKKLTLKYSVKYPKEKSLIID